MEEIKPSHFTLQLADKFLLKPVRLVEDILIKVDKFILPIDILILDIVEDKEMPIILGRLF